VYARGVDERELDRLLRETMSDHRLTRSERRSIKTQIGPDADLAFARHRAFALAREAMQDPDARGWVVEWLEDAVKALVPVAAPAIASDVVFSPGEHCRRRLNALIAATQKTLDICVFTITDDEISRTIEAVVGRGVTVRIITDNDKAEDRGSDVDRLARAGASVREDRSEHHMHHKFAVFDRSTVATGSYNWTRSAALYNRENILVTNDPGPVRSYAEGFDQLWEEFGRH
jgi:cardiolipin hydrolase